MKYKIVLGLLIAGIIALIYFSGYCDYICIETIRCHQQCIDQFIEKNFVCALIVYLIAHVSAVTFFLPLTAILNTIAGYLFGIVIGALLSLIAGTLGSLCAFLLVRYLLKEWFQKRFQSQVRFFNHEINEYGTYYLIGIHLIMGIPFALINIVAGLSHASLRTFALTTFIGTIPGCFIHAYIGHLLRTINSVQDIVSPKIFIMIGIIGISGLLSFIITRYKKYRLD